MKKYVAIGHWEGNDNITSIASEAHTMQDFRSDLKANGFCAWIVLSENRLAACRDAADGLELYDIIRKLTSNYRKWNDICDYIEECMDIIDSRLAAV